MNTWFLLRALLLWSITPFLLPRHHVWIISSIQSLSRVWPFVTPWTAACQGSLSITNSQSLLKLMSIESVMPSNHLVLCNASFFFLLLWFSTSRPTFWQYKKFLTNFPAFRLHFFLHLFLFFPVERRGCHEWSAAPWTNPSPLVCIQSLHNLVFAYSHSTNV